MTEWRAGTGLLTTYLYYTCNCRRGRHVAAAEAGASLCAPQPVFFFLCLVSLSLLAWC